MRRRLVAVPLAALIIGSGAVAVAGGRHLPPPPPTPKPMSHIEGFAPLQSESFCRKHVEPGVTAFEQLALRAYPSSHSDGDIRACESGSSEHYDGRAWDWGVDHRKPKLRADGKSMLRWLFAPDADGNKDAMFRRLGLMYVIWNKRIWGTWDKQWQPYHCHGANACHVTHIHFSFGWAGAERRTSYWTGKVSSVRPPDYPVFRHGHRTVVVSAKTGTATPVWQLKGGATYDVIATGVWRHSRARLGRSDATCADGRDGWTPSPATAAQVRLSTPTAVAGTWRLRNATKGPCDTTSHTYRMRLEPQRKSSVSVTLPDPKRSNDSRSLTLRFVRVS